jgi:hypothetical protein
MSLPSSVPTKILPCHAATPRFTTSQQAFTAHSGGTFGSKDQRRSPVAAFTANTLLQALVKYITPSINQRRRFLASARVEIRVPSDRKFTGILVVDLGKRTEPLLVVSAAVAHPVACIIVGVEQPARVNFGEGCGVLRIS